MAEASTSDTKRPVLAREPLVLNERPMSWVTNRICGIVENRQPFLWWILFVPSVVLMGVLGYCLAYLVAAGVGVGKQSPGWLGVGDYQFRFLDWYWACWHTDLGDPVPDSSEVANFRQPCC